MVLILLLALILTLAAGAALQALVRALAAIWADIPRSNADFELGAE